VLRVATRITIEEELMGGEDVFVTVRGVGWKMVSQGRYDYCDVFLTVIDAVTIEKRETGG